MCVSEFVTSDQEVIGYFSSVPGEDRPERFLTALKTGVIALKTIGTTEKVDYIEKCFNGLMNDFDNRIEQTLGEDGQFSEMLERHFGPDGIIIKELFDPHKTGTPLEKLRSGIEKMINDLRTDLKIKSETEKIEARTALKGKKFEDIFEMMLSEVAKSSSDIVERTTDTPGFVPPSKKGDFVVALGERPDIRLVFETKDVKQSQLPQILRDMDEALVNRKASYAIHIAKTVDSLPPAVGWFNEYKGKILIIALSEKADDFPNPEIARIAYKWARTRALIIESSSLKGFDSKLIQDKLQEARRTLRKLAQVRTECSNAEKATEGIRDIIDQIQSDLEQIVDSINSEIQKAAASVS